MSNRKYAPILPSPATTKETSNSEATADGASPESSNGPQRSAESPNRRRRKREQVSVACQACRNSKQKCSAERPACERCRAKGVECQYDVEEGEATRYVALQRKYDDLSSEHARLVELFDYLRTRPESEAREIYNRIRLSNDVQQVLRAVRDADLLLSSPADSGQSPPEIEEQSKRVDQRSPRDSPIKVPARPWTTVAGDGLVSELISSFFLHDDPFFLPFIDRYAFVEEMRMQNLSDATFCSPLLVNAICALRCFTSPTVKSLGRAAGEVLKEKFVAEAKVHLEQDAQNAALPTVQALFIIFLLAFYKGHDKEASRFRHAACEMLKKLDLERKYQSLGMDGIANVDEKRLASKALWGMFHAESCCSYISLRPSLILPPTIPRVFDSETTNETREWEAQVNEQLADNSSAAASGQAVSPLVHGAMEFACQLSEMLYEVMTYNASKKSTVGNEEDVERRRGFYTALEKWTSGLPADMQSTRNFTLQTYLLKTYIDEIALAILRPLPASTQIIGLSGGVDSVKNLCIQRCVVDLELSQQFLRATRSKIWSAVEIHGVLNAALTLVPYLSESHTHEAFTMACVMLRDAANDFPMLILMLKGVRDLARTLKQAIPSGARYCFEDVESDGESSTDAPGAFALSRSDSRSILSENEQSSEMGGELGSLISRWARLSLG